MTVSRFGAMLVAAALLVAGCGGGGPSVETADGVRSTA
jgi:hypothetical protein